MADDTTTGTDFPSADVLERACVAAGAAIVLGMFAALAGHGSDWLALLAAALFLTTPNRWEHQ